MPHKNKTDLAYIAVFFAMLLFMFLGMPFCRQDSSAEKRTAVGFPALRTESGALNLDFFDGLSDYISDHFAFRQQLATADALLKAQLFDSPGNEKVVLGQNKWLYYSGSMDDYFGRNVMNEREIHNAAEVLFLLQENAEAKDRQFLFVTAPNKNSVYPENMEARYVRTKELTNYDRLNDKLKTLGVHTVDLREAFLADDRTMYYRWDSHWNNEGAAFATDIMMDALSKEHHSYADETYTITKSHRGDIMNLIFPSLPLLDEEVVYGRAHAYTYVNPVESVEDILILTKTEGKEGSLIMFRDSYGNAALPFLADEYGNALFSKGVPYNLSLADSVSADTVIVEIVERNLSWLTMYVPYMEAPVRSLDLQNLTVKTGTGSTMQREDKGADYVLYGKVDANYLDAESNIYVRVTGEDGEKTLYEAFPASFTETAQAADAENSYGIYISKEEMPENGTAEVISKKGSAYFSFPFDF